MKNDSPLGDLVLSADVGVEERPRRIRTEELVMSVGAHTLNVVAFARLGFEGNVARVIVTGRVGNPSAIHCHCLLGYQTEGEERVGTL